MARVQNGLLFLMRQLMRLPVLPCMWTLILDNSAALRSPPLQCAFAYADHGSRLITGRATHNRFVK